MTTKQDHLNFIKKQGRFIVDCHKDVFTRDELELLEEYGHWLKALSEEKLKPLNMKQEFFIRVIKGEYEPESLAEVAWHKYLDQKFTEREAGDAEDQQYLPYEDQFYNRKMAKQLRKTMYGVMMENHRTV